MCTPGKEISCCSRESPSTDLTFLHFDSVFVYEKKIMMEDLLFDKKQKCHREVLEYELELGRDFEKPT